MNNRIPDLNAVYDNQEADCFDFEREFMKETILHISTHRRLVCSPSGSVLLTHSRRDLVRKHRTKTRAILRDARDA